jgi:hypothetical protein
MVGSTSVAVIDLQKAITLLTWNDHASGKRS